ncbi:putative quinol monooxygenase [Kutzneria sp. CA-103260]|uniref:putative quinol monooxygenase n=1 Tax=Kutzneria sp. CA-103260 TaxID=2802641 RepID=UPI001BAD134C|nr:antibiotic biosynthesis monooxygenase [Kutzneria sp. CA-103260]
MIIISVTTTLADRSDRDRLAELLTASRVETLKEPGVVEYKITADFRDPRVLHSLEIYRDEAGLRAHAEAPHLRAVLAATSTMDIKMDATAWTGDTEPFDLSSFLV